ncbi:hypothetical protein [Hoeflea sp.]|uniref:hypothetical protein n=1 Tax=Hoeflea sp. TaxID=1940281 RepID=UPI003B015602
MSSERIFNVFVYFENGAANEYGIIHHRQHGTDLEKKSFLRSKIDSDFPIAKRFALPQTYTVAEWRAVQRAGQVVGKFEEGFVHYRATNSPLLCVTSIVDGVPRSDVQSDLSPFQGEQVGLDLPGDMDDWLIKYTEGNTFRLDQLIDDDFFNAIRLLFNERHLVSGSKLLMSCIDTLAFVEHGDAPRNFTKWLSSYVDLSPLNITAVELWEFRNSVLHMTNLTSRKVKKGQTSALMPFIGTGSLIEHAQLPNMKPLDFGRLIILVADGIKKWGDSYNADPNKFLKFIGNYPATLSSWI